MSFLADSVLFKEKCISPKAQIQILRNLVEMCFTSYLASIKILASFDFQIATRFQLFHHCYMLKTVALQLTSFIPKLRHLLSNSHEICTAPYTISLEHLHQFYTNLISFDHLNMAKITASLDFQYRTDFNYLSYTSSSMNQT